jgi:hypothetical protein
MKQTAVQFLGTKLMYLNMNPKEIKDFLNWYEEAKELEKNQIESAHRNGAADIILKRYKEGQYYNETYK